jgi:DmsE family decaheme c-type cytochrome
MDREKKMKKRTMFKDTAKIKNYSFYTIRRYALQHIKIKPIPALMGLAVFMIAFMLFIPISAAAAGAGDDQVQTCAECHDELAAAFKKSAHAVIDSKGLAGHAGAKFSCESCHGDLSKHLEEAEAGNIFAFKKTDPATAKTKNCLACHNDTHGDYFGSSHAKAAMDCGSCHSIHGKTKPMLLKGSSMKLCWSCHEDVFAKFKLNERHRLAEGILECTSCHNPHKSANRERLGGFKQQACFKCHTDKQGPYLYEHASVVIDGCTVCHDVHGSPNRHMLVDQSVTQLCYSCHTVVPGWHSRFTPASNCANCHIAIHGSNFSPKLLK